MEKNCVSIVGTPSKSAANWFVAENEVDLMQHIIKLFVPPRGIVLDFGDSYTLVSSCLKPSVQRNVKLLSVYNDEKPVSGFSKEAVTLSRSACEGSGSKDNDE